MSSESKEVKVLVIGDGGSLAKDVIDNLFHHPRATIVNGELHIATIHPIGGLHMGREAAGNFQNALPDLDMVKLSSTTDYGNFEPTSVIPFDRKLGSRKGKGKSK